jgi:hypothetical protein
MPAAHLLTEVNVYVEPLIDYRAPGWLTLFVSLRNGCRQTCGRVSMIRWIEILRAIHARHGGYTTSPYGELPIKILVEDQVILTATPILSAMN